MAEVDAMVARAERKPYDLQTNLVSRATINHVHHASAVRRKNAELDLRYGWDEGAVKQKLHDLNLQRQLIYTGLR